MEAIETFGDAWSALRRLIAAIDRHAAAQAKSKDAVRHNRRISADETREACEALAEYVRALAAAREAAK